MDKPLVYAILAIAAGTCLMRILPLLWMQRHLSRRKAENPVDSLPDWLSVLGPSMIAALLGASLVPTTLTITNWMATFLGVVVTLLVWRHSRSLGLPVFVGVIVYGAVKLLGSVAL